MAHMGTRCASKPEPFVIVQLYPAKQIWLPEEVLDQCAKGGWYKRMKAIARARERESERERGGWYAWGIQPWKIR